MLTLIADPAPRYALAPLMACPCICRAGTVAPGVRSRVPTFSIVIASHNGASWLPSALVSVLAQTHRDYEVVVVDDGSTDDTQRVLAPYSERIQVVTQLQGGVSAARNAGVDRASGTYVVFLDADDRLFPWTLHHFADAIASHGAPTLLMGMPTHFRDEAELDHQGDTTPQAERWGDYLEAAYRSYRITIATAVRREALLACGGFRETKTSEDHDLFLRLGIAPGFVFVRAPAMYAYRQHREGASHDARSTNAGLRFLTAEERAGRYPGGRARAPQRRHILARLVRYKTRRCIAEGAYREAADLYLRGFMLLARAGFRRDCWRLPVELARHAVAARKRTAEEPESAKRIA